MYISTEVEGYIEMAIRIVIDYAKENKLRTARVEPYRSSVLTVSISTSLFIKHS